MKNVSSVSHCPKCGVLGHVILHRGFYVHVKCPNCKLGWKTMSEQCPICKNPNGYLIKGTCGKCYSENHKDKHL